MRFKDDAHLLHIIEKIVSQVGRRIDEAQPIMDARLQDGSRVNAIIPLETLQLSVRARRCNRFRLKLKLPIASTIERTDGNIKEAAALLGIDRSTLCEKIERYEIAR
ncbi:MAG: helix-turn-helix domain-containing protein [Bryobacteraceae bacterium]